MDFFKFATSVVNPARSRWIRTVSALAIATAVLTACVSKTQNTSSDGNAGPPPVGDGKATVTFGSTVDAATRARVARIASAAESVPAADTTTLTLPNGGFPAAVMAFNNTGAPLLATFAKPNANSVLDSRSTALLLTRSLLPSSIFQLPDESTLQALIVARPEFGEVVTTVQQLATQGQSYAHSREAVAKAATAAVGLLRDLPPSSATDEGSPWLTQQGARTGAVHFQNFPIGVEGSRGTVTFTNESFANFVLELSRGVPPRAEINGRSLCLFCLPPRIGLYERLSSTVDGDGLLNVSASFVQE
jgi:hypothetical protein